MSETFPKPRGGGAGSRVTVREVAREAGVAVSTVSKALNGSGELRPETRQRVHEVAERLGFVIDGVGRSLVSGRTFTVGVLTGDEIGRFSLPVMLGAENALAAGKMLVFLCDSRDDPIREQHYLRHLLERRVEGVIVTGRRTEARAPLDARVPTVYAYRPSSDPGDSSVTADDEEGARMVVDHLVTLGRRHLAHVTGPARHRSACVRSDGVAARLAEYGLELAQPPLHGAWSEAWGRAAVDALLTRRGLTVDAITCGSDQVARGVTEQLRERGVNVPGDIAVTGYDDWDVMVEASRPPLTTVNQRLEELGRRAAEILLEKMAGNPHSGVERISPRLLSRASTLGGS